MEGGNFVDYVKIKCRSGNGGAGSSHLRREKYVPKGGPDGGNGGKGGDIILVGNKQLWTLLHLKYRKHISAGNGGNGHKQQMDGAAGEDMILEVPLGTVAKNAETGEVYFEINDDGERRVLLPGGKGGLGNHNFKSATNQTPRYAQPGLPGKEEWNILELKLLADVGLVGFPNAGKSTLLSIITNARPKIGAYPFTTLVPNLGIVGYRNNRSFVMADIPGIIEGAHEGKGLGHRFLRHIERNSLLLFMIPIDSDDIKKEYEVLANECAKYNPELLDKQRLLAITKTDLADEELLELVKDDLPDVPYEFISAITQNGLTELKDLIWKHLNSEEF